MCKAPTVHRKSSGHYERGRSCSELFVHFRKPLADLDWLDTLFSLNNAIACSSTAKALYTFFLSIMDNLQWNSVKVQPISTLRLPNHARTAAELPNRQNSYNIFKMHALPPKLAGERCSL